MTTDPQDFDGCNRKCRKAGAHTRVWGECEFGIEPEPTVSMSRVYTDHDGYPSIGFDSYTVQQLADLIEPGLRTVPVRLGPNALGMLGRGETVGLSGGEYADLAWTAAHAIVHRHDGPPAVSVPPPPPARAATRGLSVPHRDALYDAVAPPGPARPTFPEQHERVCRAVAEILDEVAPPVPAADRAVVLREAADRFDEIADELAATQERGRGVFFLERPVIRDAEVWSAAAKELRRLADEEQPATEAHPPSHTWKVESPRRDQWASWGATYDERVWAAASFEDVVEVAPQRPFRLVRATTTYTVEAEHTPPAPVAQQPAAEAWVCKCPAGLCGCGHHAPTEQQPAAADTGEEA